MDKIYITKEKLKESLENLHSEIRPNKNRSDPGLFLLTLFVAILVLVFIGLPITVFIVYIVITICIIAVATVILAIPVYAFDKLFNSIFKRKNKNE